MLGRIVLALLVGAAIVAIDRPAETRRDAENAAAAAAERAVAMCAANPRRCESALEGALEEAR